MIKLITTFSLIAIFVLFSNCHSNEKKEDFEKKDSLKLAADTGTALVNNKYLIVPPDSDYTGDYIDRYPNGVIKFTGFFRFGQRHGQWMAFYENGIKWSECFYDNGKRQGASMVYFPNGKLQYSGWFKNDLRDSLWFFYDEKTGKELDKRAYRNDTETGLVN